MRLIHTADWQIGKTFGFAPDDVLQTLQDERLEAILRLGRLGRAEGAPVILVAGDIYDSESPSDRTLRQPLERMRQFPDLRWHLIPGNHDAHLPNGVWSRVQRSGVPENVTLHLAPSPSALDAEGTACLLPGALTRRHTMTDTTAWMDDAPTPDGTIRIGLAHGSVTGFGTETDERQNPVAPDRPERAGLAYLALGDWHGFNRIGERCAYSGTPECDRFDTGGGGGGEALTVSIDGPRAIPDITRHRIGRFSWHTVSATLSSSDDVDALDHRLRALDPDEPSRVLVRLRAAGHLSLAALTGFEKAIVKDAADALRFLRVESVPELAATDDDLTLFDGAGAVADAAARLRALGATAGPDQPHALAALQRLATLWQKERRA